MSANGRYTVVRKIADGGMAEIFLGIQHGAAGFQRPVVIKAIRTVHLTDEHFRNVLIDEAHIAMSLRHSNIVQVLDLGAASGRYFLILELVDGWDLHQILKRVEATKMRLPTAMALHITAEVCRALAYAHSKTRDGKPLGIVHRDVSPHNILVSEQGEVKLTDFGIASASTKQEKTVPGLIKGKVGFMSPEQAAGAAIDARSDLFALGAVLYVMVTGRKPFAADTDLESLLRTQEAKYFPIEKANPDLEHSVSRILVKAMQKDPDDRYESAEEMLEHVEHILRTDFDSAGQTELKKWLGDLSRRDKQVPVTKLSAPPLPGADEPLGDEKGNALVLSEVEKGKPPPPRRGPPPPPEPTPAAGSVAPQGRKRSWLVPVLGLAGVGAAGAFLALHPPRSTPRPAPPAAVPAASEPAVVATAPSPAPVPMETAPVDAGLAVAAAESDAGAVAAVGDAGTPVAVAVAEGDAGAAQATAASGDAGAPAVAELAQAEPADAGPAPALQASAAPGDAGAAVVQQTAPAEEAPPARKPDPAKAEVAEHEPPTPRPAHAPEKPRPPAPADEGTGNATAEESDSVSVKFVSEPPGAAVRVEKKTFGVTPVSVRFKPGVAYDVKFDLAGFEVSEKRVFVSKRKNQSVQISLKKKPL